MNNTEKLVYRYIKDYVEKHCYPPTVREICEGVGIKSTSSVHAHIKSLMKKGLLGTDSNEGVSRAIRVTGYSVSKSDDTVNNEILLELIDMRVRWRKATVQRGHCPYRETGLFEEKVTGCQCSDIDCDLCKSKFFDMYREEVVKEYKEKWGIKTER